MKGRRLRPAPFADTLPGTEALLYAPRMSWRNELKLADLPAGEALELTCPKCGAARYATAAELSAHKMPGALDGETVSLATAYLDQVEARLRCRRSGQDDCRGCGKIRSAGLSAGCLNAGGASAGAPAPARVSTLIGDVVFDRSEARNRPKTYYSAAARIEMPNDPRLEDVLGKPLDAVS